MKETDFMKKASRRAFCIKEWFDRCFASFWSLHKLPCANIRSCFSHERILVQISLRRDTNEAKNLSNHFFMLKAFRFAFFMKAVFLKRFDEFFYEVLNYRWQTSRHLTWRLSSIIDDFIEELIEAFERNWFHEESKSKSFLH